MNVYLGANAKAQAICFALCFAIGLAGGVFALLFLRKANPLERALTDIFGSVLITGAFFCAFYFVMQGEPTLYGIAAFILGVALVPLCVRKMRKTLRKSRKTKRRTLNRTSKIFKSLKLRKRKNKTQKNLKNSANCRLISTKKRLSLSNNRLFSQGSFF